VSVDVAIKKKSQVKMGGGEKKEEKYGASQSWWASIWLSVYIHKVV
jgi:hypothetical protein